MPNTVSIIDGNALFIQRSSNLSTQKSSYSEYKSHTTVKFLVSTDPFTGMLNFVSTRFSVAGLWLRTVGSWMSLGLDSAFWLIEVYS